ncbi:hypothetical protein LC55x_1833 [Lysobacter capsici]|nr:hypothetical protein LC55x_1833 [Lysobacter capsici]
MLCCFEAGIGDWGFGIRNSEARPLISRIPNLQSRFPSAARGAWG